MFWSLSFDFSPPVEVEEGSSFCPSILNREAWISFCRSVVMPISSLLYPGLFELEVEEDRADVLDRLEDDR